jgi:hypothetical protein
MLRMNVVAELAAAFLLQPRPGDDVPILDPESDLPLLLATLVLARAPRNVTHVPRSARAEQPPLVERELLHPCDDRRAEPPDADLCLHETLDSTRRLAGTIAPASPRSARPTTATPSASAGA